MEHVEDNCDKMIVSPNDCTPTGPTSFYMANAHRFNSHGRGGIQEFLVRVEGDLGLWKFTNVIHCGGGSSGCKEVAGGFVGANGVLLVKDLLYVDDWQELFSNCAFLSFAGVLTSAFSLSMAFALIRVPTLRQTFLLWSLPFFFG
jgi:hypothetical protein